MLCPKGRVGSTPTTGTSAARAADQVVLECEGRSLGAGTDTELDEDVAHVAMDGALACPAVALCSSQWRWTVRSLRMSSVAIM